MKFGAGRPLHAVVGPQHLRTVRGRDGLERLFARMDEAKEGVRADASPASTQVDETRGEPVDDRHHFIAARHRQRPAGTKIVLHIDHDENVVAARWARSFLSMILDLSIIQDLSLRRLQAAIDLVGELDQIVGDLDRIGRAPARAAATVRQSFELALRLLPDFIERRRRPQAPAFRITG